MTIKLIIFRGLTGTGKSTVAKILIKRCSHRLKHIDIDKTREVDPAENVCFLKAGEQARKEIDDGYIVIAHDAFDSVDHLELFLKAADFSFNDRFLTIFRLECTLAESLNRNENERCPPVTENQTRQQYDKRMEEVPGNMERVIDTGSKTAEEVAEKILSIISSINKSIKTESMFLVGTGFWKASKILSIYHSKTVDFDVVSPIFVNLALAGEIYLKCLRLIKANNRLRKKHDLKTLFNDLPQQDQLNIENAYNKNIAKCSGLSVMEKDDIKLSTMLDEAGKTFEKWRYSYEAMPNPTNTLDVFVDTLQQYLIGIDSNLTSGLHLSLSDFNSLIK